MIGEKYIGRRKKVLMREDPYQDSDLVLLPDDIFEIAGYSAANIDHTELIDDHIMQSLSMVTNGGSIDLYINYGFTRALVSTLNIIFQKNLECGIYIYNNESRNYVYFGNLSQQSYRHIETPGLPTAEFQLINRANKKALPKSVQHVFSEKEIEKERLFDAGYFNKIAYKSLKDFAGGHVFLYITGLKQALIACVNASRKLGIRLTMKHYNPDDESYEHEQELYIAS